MELGGCSSCIYIFQDEFATELIVGSWNVILVDGVHILEMVLALLGAVEVVVKAHDGLNISLIVDWYVEDRRLEGQLVEKPVPLE